jgi:hypothetical protein
MSSARGTVKIIPCIANAIPETGEPFVSPEAHSRSSWNPQQSAA